MRINNFLHGNFGESLAYPSLSLLERELIESLLRHLWLFESDVLLSVIKNQPRLFLSCTDDLPRKRLSQIYKPPTPEMLAYLDFSVSTTGMLTGVKVR